jgi:hypothetical protein
MTDAEQLVTLRAWPGWPWKTLDPLAVEAATMGRLREAVADVERLRAERLVNRSSSTIPAAQAPVSGFCYLDSRSNFFYRHLWIELHRVLHRAVPLSEWDGWD